MKTTNILVEMITIGFFSLVWLLILLYLIDHVLFLKVINFIEKINPTVIVLILLIILNQIGWLIGWLSYITLQLIGKPIRFKLFRSENLEYEKVRSVVYQFGSHELRTDLGIDRMVVRLSRGGFLNFFLISVSVVLLGYYSYAFISLLISLLFLLQWESRYKRYHFRMIQGYRVIIQYETDRQSNFQ